MLTTLKLLLKHFAKLELKSGPGIPRARSATILLRLDGPLTIGSEQGGNPGVFELLDS
jgi:hypothetical protein